MKIVKYLGLIFFLVIILGLLVALFLFSLYKVERTIVIEKPLQTIYQLASDYNLRDNWDPWLSRDLEAEVSINITKDKMGSIFSWEGQEIGSGRITIKKVELNKHIFSELEFINLNKVLLM